MKIVTSAGPAESETAPFSFFVQWHLTERCNLRCRHCYQQDASTGELSLDEISPVVDEISETVEHWAKAYDMVFSPSVNVTGGEPFLRRDLFEALELMKRKGFELFLLTNGTRVGHDEARRLAALGMGGVQVSLEGPEEINDRIRGRGSFQSALKGIRHLVDAGIEVTVNATLSGMNVESAGELMRLAASLGARRFGFSRIVPCGSGTELLGQMVPADTLRKTYEALMASAPRGIEVVTGDPLASGTASHDDGPGCTAVGGCAAGLSGITILPDGTLVPCRRMPIPIGNVRTDSIREVWVASDVLNDLRDRGRYAGKCGSCARWATCRGCRAIAYAYSVAQGRPDYLADDPQCFHSV